MKAGAASIRFAFAIGIAILVLLGIGGRSCRNQSEPAIPSSCGPSAALPSKSKIDIRIVFGYKDARPARFVGDRYERVATIEALLKPCAGNRFDCGFRRSEADADLLVKDLEGADHRSHRIELRVTASAAGPDDEENRRDPFQGWQSAHAEKSFLTGIRQADVVFYDGHSRSGGGPDFRPPRLRLDNHVDYGWYGNRKRGIRAMKGALVGAKNPAKIVGLYSCDSNRLTFKSPAAKDVRWVTYDKLYYFADALRDIHDSLSALLKGSCAATH